MALRWGLGLALMPGLVAAPPAGMDEAARARHLASFDQVALTVAERHWDPTLGGVDWAAAKAELRPRVERAASAEEAREAMRALLGRLKQSHFGIVPAEVYSDLQAGGSGGGATPGLTLRLLGNEAVVMAVEPGSSAEQAGVKPGWALLKAGDKAVPERGRKLAEVMKDSTQQELVVSRGLEGMLSGPAGQTVEATFDTGQGTRTLTLERRPPRGKLAGMGNMPSIPFWVEHRTLPGPVAYLTFNAWMEAETVAKAFQAALAEAGPEAKGFILDLRGNPGGIGGMAMGAAGWFTAQSGLKLGTMSLRGANLNFVVFPRPNPFTKPLAILVDGGSASTSEIFAGGMQDLGRARIFGGRTAGAALPSVFARLPNGDGFQYAIATYASQGGQVLEARGVIPDEPVTPTRAELLAGRDPVLERALAWIQRPSR